MKQRLLLSELDMKRLRDRVQHLQNELIRVSQALGRVQRSIRSQKQAQWGGKLTSTGFSRLPCVPWWLG